MAIMYWSAEMPADAPEAATNVLRSGLRQNSLESKEPVLVLVFCQPAISTSGKSPQAGEGGREFPNVDPRDTSEPCHRLVNWKP